MFVDLGSHLEAAGIRENWIYLLPAFCMSTKTNAVHLTALTKFILSLKKSRKCEYCLAYLDKFRFRIYSENKKVIICFSLHF